MKRLLLTIALLASTPAIAQQADPWSANNMVQPCKRWANQEGGSNPYSGTCAGAARTLLTFAPTLGACPPDNASIGQLTKIIVRYAEQRPERLHEDYLQLALEALRAAWPCKGGR
ncbi:MAG: hypothetical protein GEU95_21660 [Rhizobiales bacterium]|nr:hypothetical protein [Hyphomicrobiales bacterium]